MSRKASSRNGYVAGHVGRKLFLVDIENYCGKPVLTEEDVAFVKEDLSKTCGVSENDLVVIGTSHSSNLICSWIGWPGARQVIMFGHDGADKALIDAVAEYRIETFAEVILISGDGIFFWSCQGDPSLRRFCDSLIPCPKPKQESGFCCDSGPYRCPPHPVDTAPCPRR